MGRTSKHVRKGRGRLAFGTALVAGSLAIAVASSFAQVSPEEHAKHHPGQAQQPSTAPAGAGGMGEGGTGAGGMDGMGAMMEGMHGGAPQRELYPSLMSVPELTPEKRAELTAAAHERMKAGTAMMGQGLERLANGAAGDDFAAMQAATEQVREGLARFDSGLAAHRAMAEGKPPRDVALQWFRQEMNLAAPADRHGAAGTLGLSWFHFWVMLVLVLFTGAMLWMYFFKMRRASLLLSDLTGGVAPSAPAQSVPAPSAPAATPSVAAAAPAAGKKWSGQLRVGHVFQETPNVKTFRLMNPLGGVLPFGFLPGQFVTVTIPTDGKPVKRSYTVASSPAQHDYAELTVKHEEGGVVSGFFHTHVKPGDLLQCSGPYGTFIFTGRECKCILLIGAGVGVTPLMGVLRYLLDRSWDGEIFLLYACRTPADIIFREELDYLQRRHKNLRVVITISRPEGTDWKGATGRVTKELITQSVPDLRSRYVHICGPVPMMEATKQMLADLGVPRERIKVEAFGPAAGKVERTPEAATEVPKGEAPAVALPTLTFSKSEKSAPLPPDKVILEVAEENNVDIDYSCRVGICGVCRIKKTSGEVSMEVQEGLQPGDKENAIILACQAKSTGNVTVEA